MSLVGALTSKAILTPLRLPFTLPPRLPHRPTRFEGEGGIALHGWVLERKPEWVEKRPHARGWLVYLHGWSSNRFQAAWVERARFDIDDVSPLVAAASIRVPVLLVHGSEDPWTPPWHSERIFDALAGPKERYRVGGAGHDGVLWRKDAWARMVDWSERVFAPQARRQQRQEPQRSDDSQSSQT